MYLKYMVNNVFKRIITLNTARIAIFLMLILFFCCLPVYSKKQNIQANNQQVSPETLQGKVEIINLKSVVEYTLAKNIDMKIARARIEQAKYYYKGSFASFLPSITPQFPVERFKGGEIFYGPIPINLDRTTYRPAIYGDYQLYTGGKPIFDTLASKNQYSRLKVGYNTTLQKTLLNSCKMYFEWLKNASDVDVADQSLQEAETQLKTNTARLRTGFGTKLDVLQTKTLVLDRKNLLLQAENKKDSSRISLASFLCIPPSMEMEPEKNYLEPLSLWDKNLTLPQLYDISSKTRPDIQELAYSLVQSKNQLRSLVAELFPSVGLSGYKRGIGPQLNSLDGTTQGLLNINLGFLKNLGLGAWSDVKVARARLKESILNKEKILNDIYKTIAQSYYDCKYFDEQLKITQEKVSDAKEAYRIALVRMKNGIGINLEVIQAQSELTKSNLEYQNAVKNYNIAQIELLYECGQLTPEKLLSAIR